MWRLPSGHQAVDRWSVIRSMFKLTEAKERQAFANSCRKKQETHRSLEKSKAALPNLRYHNLLPDNLMMLLIKENSDISRLKQASPSRLWWIQSYSRELQKHQSNSVVLYEATVSQVLTENGK